MRRGVVDRSHSGNQLSTFDLNFGIQSTARFYEPKKAEEKSVRSLSAGMGHFSSSFVKSGEGENAYRQPPRDGILAEFELIATKL
jgi:hypothetical protein